MVSLFLARIMIMTNLPLQSPLTSKARIRFELCLFVDCREKLLSNLLYVSFAVKKDTRLSEKEERVSTAPNWNRLRQNFYSVLQRAKRQGTLHCSPSKNSIMGPTIMGWAVILCLWVCMCACSYLVTSFFTRRKFCSMVATGGICRQMLTLYSKHLV